MPWQLPGAITHNSGKLHQNPQEGKKMHQNNSKSSWAAICQDNPGRVKKHLQPFKIEKGAGIR
jgi:hypothetical protein